MYNDMLIVNWSTSSFNFSNLQIPVFLKYGKNKVNSKTRVAWYNDILCPNHDSTAYKEAVNSGMVEESIFLQ